MEVLVLGGSNSSGDQLLDREAAWPRLLGRELKAHPTDVLVLYPATVFTAATTVNAVNARLGWQGRPGCRASPRLAAAPTRPPHRAFRLQVGAMGREENIRRPVMWGQVELEPEVADWLRALPDKQFGRAAFAIDLLAAQGVQLAFPHSSQLSGKVRELRFYIDRRSWRVTYYIATGRRIVLLTVFSKRAGSEPAEVQRAEKAMQRCITRKGTRSRRPEMETWNELREERLRAPGAQASYARSLRAYQLGCQVRALRRGAGLSQQALAVRAGTSTASIARLESGASEPRTSTLEKVGRALNVRLVASPRT